jgi:heme oxygenase
MDRKSENAAKAKPFLITGNETYTTNTHASLERRVPKRNKSISARQFKKKLKKIRRIVRTHIEKTLIEKE